MKKAHSRDMRGNLGSVRLGRRWDDCRGFARAQADVVFVGHPLAAWELVAVPSAPAPSTSIETARCRGLWFAFQHHRGSRILRSRASLLSGGRALEVYTWVRLSDSACRLPTAKRRRNDASQNSWARRQSQSRHTLPVLSRATPSFRDRRACVAPLPCCGIFAGRLRLQRPERAGSTTAASRCLLHPFGEILVTCSIFPKGERCSSVGAILSVGFVCCKPSGWRLAEACGEGVRVSKRAWCARLRPDSQSSVQIRVAQKPRMLDPGCAAVAHTSAAWSGALTPRSVRLQYREELSKTHLAHALVHDEVDFRPRNQREALGALKAIVAGQSC